MKNFKLLLATTAILSTGLAIQALANSELSSNQTKLQAEAKFIAPMIMTQVSPLDFGTILADEGGKNVTVGTDGKYYDTDAEIMLRNAYDIISGAKAGKISVTGAPFNNLTETEVSKYRFLLDQYTFDITPVEENTGIETCGTVFVSDSQSGYKNNELYLLLGGSLTTADMSTLNVPSIRCKGETTITLFLLDSE